ncbi:hypothetical protein V1477_014048 [Vespula maculifrons]|uniref:Uncharacterized protein n=1 Tax=Vespula maculifrons TaxID=7453 RepID=A0ABD2BLF9_VESMC
MKRGKVTDPQRFIYSCLEFNRHRCHENLTETNFKSPFRRTAKSERFLIKFFAPTKRTNDKWYAMRISKSRAQITKLKLQELKMGHRGVRA